MASFECRSDLPLVRTHCIDYFQWMTAALSKPEVIITHESDLDGLVAGVLLTRLAKSMFETDVPLQAYHYHSWRQRDLRERSLG